MEFGDYIIYVDESGDHSLTAIDENFPVFSLAFCVFRKSEYIEQAVPLFQALKFRWFGHDAVVFHEADIVKRKGPFHFLQYDNLRETFHEDLASVMEKMPMHVSAAVIRKDALKRKYTNPENPYQLALLFCMEQAHSLLKQNDAHEPRCHIICESRSPKTAGTGKEDASLELEFRRIAAGDHYLQGPRELSAMSCFDIRFVSKLANSTGLQIADLIARPIALRVMRPMQENKAFEIIRKKLIAMKSFP